MRAAIGLRYYLDLPVETVAEVLDVSPNTIKTQLKSALTHCGRPSPTNRCPSRRCDMPELDDAALERRLRGVLQEHLGALPLDLTVDDSGSPPGGQGALPDDPPGVAASPCLRRQPC